MMTENVSPKMQQLFDTDKSASSINTQPRKFLFKYLCLLLIYKKKVQFLRKKIFLKALKKLHLIKTSKYQKVLRIC